MTRNQEDEASHHEELPDPPEGLEIMELVENHQFRIREFASRSTKAVGSSFLAIGIAVLMIPITRISIAEDYLKARWESMPSFVPLLVHLFLIGAVLCLLFQIMRLLFGSTEVRGTMNRLSSHKTLFGIPWTRSMDQRDFRSLELKYFRGQSNTDSGTGPLPGTWKLSMIGSNHSLTFHRTTSMDEAKWLARFVSTWYDVELEQTRNKRRFGW